MPCTSPGAEAESAARDQAKMRKLEALLCAVFTVLETHMIYDQTLNRVDWQEAGVTKAWARTWWHNHKKKDEARRLGRERAEQIKQARAAAIAKLTPEERALLGLRP